MKTRSERIEKLAAKRRRLGQQIDRIRAAAAQEERKREARRKILVGSMLLAMVERGEWPRERLLEQLDGYLTRSHDRALFELEPTQPAPAGRERRAS